MTKKPAAKARAKCDRPPRHEIIRIKKGKPDRGSLRLSVKCKDTVQWIGMDRDYLIVFRSDGIGPASVVVGIPVGPYSIYVPHGSPTGPHKAKRKGRHPYAIKTRVLSLATAALSKKAKGGPLVGPEIVGDD